MKIFTNFRSWVKKITHILNDLIDVSLQKSKGNEKGMSKTPKFSACGGLNSKNNSIIYSLSVKDGILIDFEYKSPRSGEKKFKGFFRREAAKIFWSVFLNPNSKPIKKHCWGVNNSFTDHNLGVSNISFAKSHKLYDVSTHRMLT